MLRDSPGVSVKLINNTLYTQISNRLSPNQFRANPRQQDCDVAATAAPGCASIRLFSNGAAGASVLQSAAEAGLNRTDRRTIAGVRWEHRFDEATNWHPVRLRRRRHPSADRHHRTLPNSSP